MWPGSREQCLSSNIFSILRTVLGFLGFQLLFAESGMIFTLVSFPSSLTIMVVKKLPTKDCFRPVFSGWFSTSASHHVFRPCTCNCPPVISLCCSIPTLLLLGYPPSAFIHSQGNKWGVGAARVPPRSPGGWQCNQCPLLIREMMWDLTLRTF